ncbi:hypothetical protein [Tychonema sp. BBK16]|uniref:hypothetical protein n=1 Tax=Tychonema sp. BBK16 TaxID=2699888 RepID=UPI001F43E21A|nr:hypothetical protein [Tychonema sp. BBK16]MCF6375424.1 hypothetical protein [Tychonema sp. BBK16]
MKISRVNLIEPEKKTAFNSPTESEFKLTSCTNVSNGLEARSTKSEFSCGMGILPVHKRLIENGARSLFKRFFSYQPPMSYHHLRESFSDAHARPVPLTDAPTIAHLFPKRQCRKSSLTQSKDIPGGTSSQ